MTGGNLSNDFFKITSRENGEKNFSLPALSNFSHPSRRNLKKFIRTALTDPLVIRRKASVLIRRGISEFQRLQFLMRLNSKPAT